MFVKWFRTKVILLVISLSAVCLLSSSCSGNTASEPSNQIKDTIDHQTGEIIELGDEYDISQLSLLSALPDRDIYLYSRESDGVILSIGDRKYDYDWIYLTPRGILPIMQVSDFDGDGKDELSVILYMGSGTGISISELHMIEISNNPSYGNLQDHIFSSTNYVSQLQQAVSFKTSNHAGELRGELTVDTDVYPVNLKDLQSEDYGKINEEIIWGNVVDFNSDNNKLTAEFGVGVASEHAVSPIYIGKLYTDVYYEQGEFILGNHRFEEYQDK